MMKKLLSLLLSLSMLFGVNAAAKEDSYEFFTNGTFEESSSLIGWDLGGGEEDAEFKVTEDTSYEGNACLRMNTGTTVQSISFGSDDLYNVAGGEKLDFTFAINLAKQNGGGIIAEMKFYSEVDADVSTTIQDATVKDSYTDLIPGKWIEKKLSAVVPKAAKRVSVSILFEGGGEAFLDNVSLKGTYTEEAEEIIAYVNPNEYLLPMEGEEELLKNTGFEELSDSKSPAEWGNYKGGAPGDNEGSAWVGNYVTLSKTAHTGTYGVKITANESGKNPWVNQLVPEFDLNDEYQFSFWYRAEGITGKGLTMHCEHYKGEEVTTENYVRGEQGIYVKNTGGQWKQYVYRFRITDPNIKLISIYARLVGTGTVYVDDMSLYKVSGKIKVMNQGIFCREAFIYSDMEGETECYMDLNVADYPEYNEASATWKLSHGKQVLKEETIPFKDGRSTFYYQRSMLTEKKTAYTVSVEARDKEDNIIYTGRERVYKYDRPKNITKDGRIFTNDGKEVDFNVIYHFNWDHFPYADEADFSVVMASYWWADFIKDPTRIDLLLDYLEQNDLIAIIGLYINMVPGGDESLIENTRQLVTYLKGNPRILGYCLMDEPVQMMEESSYDPITRRGYKVIRDIDPDIPVFVTDTLMNEYEYQQLMKYCDFVVTDAYVAGNPRASYVAEKMELCRDAAAYCGKPSGALLQTFWWRDYFPTGEQLRQHIWQSYLAGSNLRGYFAFSDAIGVEGGNGDGDPIPLNDTPLWETLINLPEGEYHMMDTMLRAPLFSETKTEDAWWRIWEDEGKLYMTVINLHEDKDVAVSIPLESMNGKIKIDEFTAKIIYGGEKTIQGKSTLEINLPMETAYVLEIIPGSETDLSLLTKTEYDDLYNYPWARVQIEELRAKEIVNDKGLHIFAPGDKISRGEVVYFLARTLGITSENTKSFEDVDENAYYADEIAAAKEAGIIEGTGNNAFAPDSRITRQDLMTMISRALKLSGKTDLSAFVDSDKVSDYARSSVSAMLAEGLIVGNDLGEIMPLGGATRAEAAVIMHRILQKNYKI